MWAFIVRSGGNNKSGNRCRSRKRKKSSLKDGLDDPLEVIFQVPNYGKVSRARNSKRSDDKYNSKSRSTCCGGSRGATVATLGGSSANELVFAIIRILAKTATSRGLSH